MKESSKVTNLIVVTALALVSSVSMVHAQNREKFGISAKAGGVNAVVGNVRVTHEGQTPQLLTNKDDLVTGDLVTTGSLSHAEILLNPGSYLRLGENSEFEFADGSLDNLRLRLVRGSAIVEATGIDTVDLRIEVNTPQAKIRVVRAGLYRLNVQADMTDLLVQKGRAIIGDDQSNPIKKGYKATVRGGTVARVKIVKDKDEFELWSKQRAEFLARANDRLSARTLNGYLQGYRNSFSWPGTWGLWTFSSRAGCYTFLPFFYGWSSPYGGYYGSYYYWGGRDWYGGQSSIGPVIVNNQGSGSSSGGSSGGSSPGPVINPNGSGPPMQSPPPRTDPDTGMRQVNKSREP